MFRRILPLTAILLLALFYVAPIARCMDSRQAEKNREEFEKRSEIPEWPKRDWKNAYKVNSLHYTVVTNTTYNAGKFISDVMEMLFLRYKDIFGAQFARIPRMTVNAYSSRQEYDEIANKYGFQSGVTGGFYTTHGNGAIHIPYVNINGQHPVKTLFHEGTHQFVHDVIDYKVPFQLKSIVPAELHVLPSVPIWLNEGLATYMETADYDGETIEIGKVNPGRLYQLQLMIKRKVMPPLREVLSRRFGQPFSAEHYAVAWGLVYSMRHNWDVDKREQARKKLSQYIDSASKGFFKLPANDFVKKFMTGGKLNDAFMIDWVAHIGDSSLSEFERIVVGRGKKLEDWEAEWKKQILKLSPYKPYGGTNRGEAVENKGSDGF
ncbi:MAG: hypothetical protein JXR97_16415 [Planctomycetes bacterium]|nr:hypothetical protein [Planctomycetota bacterium]